MSSEKKGAQGFGLDLLFGEVPSLKLTVLHLKMDGTGRGSGFLLVRLGPFFRGELLVLGSINSWFFWDCDIAAG